MAIGFQFQKTLASCQEMELSHLRPLVDRMFENAEVALLEFAEKAENNAMQSMFFEAMNEVQKKRGTMERVFFDQVRHSFSSFPVSPLGHKDPDNENEPESEFGNLSLVDTEEMDEAIATRNAANKLCTRIREQIFALRQRMTVINSGETIAQDDIPGGPAWLGRACQLAVDELELETRTRLVIIALLDKYVLCKADELFTEYNRLLVQADILPNLKYEVRKQPGSVTPLHHSPAGDGETPEAGQDTVQQVSETTGEAALGDELFGRICDLLTVKRSHPGTSVSAGVTPSVPVQAGGMAPAPAAGGVAPAGQAGAGASRGSPLVAQINTMQASVQASAAATSSEEFISGIEIDDQFIGRLQQTLNEERKKIFGAMDPDQLPAADTNVIELVGMLFEYMLQEENLPDLAKALLSRLHTPLLKVAVIDRGFFTRSQYPARKLLNSMTSAGIRWVDLDNLERGIFPAMRTMVDRVLGEFQEDVSVFDGFLEDFEKSVEELQHRSTVVEQRTNEAAKGQEKLENARSCVHDAINARLRGRSTEPATKEFLQRIWADKMTFTLLRSQEGLRSEQWQDALALVDTMLEYARPPASEGERNERRERLKEHQAGIRAATRNLQQADKEKLLITMFAEQKDMLVSELAETPAAVAETTPAETAPESAPVPGGDEIQAHENAANEISEEKRNTLDRLKSIEFGTWFEFRKDGGKIQRAKLSWRSTVTEKFMFVDQMGVKAAVIDMYELADCLMNGSVHIIKSEKTPFVDRALKAIHKVLDIGPGKTAHAS